MTTAYDPAVSTALIDWVNSFNLPPKTNNVKALSELYDGRTISLILNDIDPKYFADGVVKGYSNSSASVNWVQHFNVLKKLLRYMTDYYTDVLRTTAPNLPAEELPNLSSIAKEQSAADIVKLLRLVLALAVKSNKKEDYVQTIYTLSPEAQKALMYLLQQVVSDPSPGGRSGEGGLSEDDQIRFEQEIAEISAERDAINKARLTLLEQNQKLKKESDRLQKSVEAAETRAREAEEAARSLGSKADSYLRSELDRLQIELQDMETKSMQKDTLLEARNALITGLNRQVDDMRPRAELATKFEEELREASSELGQTHKKVLRLENIVEKYKSKAEESTSLLRQNEALEDENVQLKESIRRGDTTQSLLRGKLDTVRFEASERAWLDEKRILQTEIDRLKDRLKVAEEQSIRNIGVIATLEERLKDSTSVPSANVDDIGGEDLNDELNISRKNLYFRLEVGTNGRRLRLARSDNELTATKAEVEFLKANVKNGDNQTDLRERFLKYETELSAANRKIADLTLLASQSGKSATSTELQTRMEQLLKQLSDLEEEKRKATSEKDDLQQQLLNQKDRMVETEREVGRLKTSLALIEGDAGGQTKGETTQLQKSLRDLTTESKFKEAEIQKLRDLVKKQDQKLKEGKARLAKATAGADQALRDENAELTKKGNSTKKSHREEVALKNKELHMIASAFHDLGQRTQLNSFVVEKLSQGPASFLAQQRNSIPSLSKKE